MTAFQHMRHAIDFGIAALARRHAVADMATVPYPWCRVLGAYYRGLFVVPTHAPKWSPARAYARGGRPRVECREHRLAIHIPDFMLALGGPMPMPAPAPAPMPISDLDLTSSAVARPPRVAALPAEVAEALEALVRRELETTNPGRFARVAKVATTVVVPERGCPPPSFSPARLRAWGCLMAFLDDGQRADYEKHDRFVVVGGSTGHRYMLTSRTNTAALRRYQRSLYDLDERRPICTHDWDVPPEEELLALGVLAQLQGHEHVLREMTH